MSVWLTAPDYPGAVPIAWHLLAMRFIGGFTPDCERFSADFEGGFDGRQFSIGAPFEIDTDGDGQLDGYRVFGTIEGVRFAP